MKTETVRRVLLSSAHERGVGGVQVVLRDLTHALRAHQIEVSTVYGVPLPSLWLRQSPRADGGIAFTCPMPAIVKDSSILSLLAFLIYLPVSLFHLTRVIRRQKIDVINCHYLEAYFLHLVCAGRFNRIPVVISVHGADVESFHTAPLPDRVFGRLTMRGATRVVACSKALALQTLQCFPEVEGKLTYVHNGLNLAPSGAAGVRSDLPKRFVLAVGRQVQKKGFDTLIQAFALVAPRVADTQLVLVGGGPLADEHEALAQALGLGQRVLFVGDVPHDQVGAFYSSCDVFVLPSRSEPFGVVLLEAALSRRPIVATRVGGVPEIIADNVNGVLVAPDDVEAMARKIEWLLSEPTVARQMGEAAHETLMAHFLWKDRVGDYIRIYQGDPGPRILDTRTLEFAADAHAGTVE